MIGETEFIQALEHLLAAVPRRFDHPWHVLIRKQIGDADYRKLTAGFEMTVQTKVAEPKATYGKEKKGHAQRGLFE